MCIHLPLIIFIAIHPSLFIDDLRIKLINTIALWVGLSIQEEAYLCY